MTWIPRALRSWPWQVMGTYKYNLFVPIFASALFARHQGTSHGDNWYLHILMLAALRYVVYQAFTTLSRLHAFVNKHQVRSYAISYEQVDREFDCDNGIILHSMILACVLCPIHTHLAPPWNWTALISALLFHCGGTELLYYCFHRALHTPFLFNAFHSLHHSSVVPEPATAGTHSFVEAIMQTLFMLLPVVGSVFTDGTSLAVIYLYPLAFDFLKYMGHFNCEIFPSSFFHHFPPLKYLLYTPSYHSLHHEDINSNFCLFMPLYDYFGGTLNKKSESFHAKARKGREVVPDFVFLVHCIDIISSLHVPFSGRTASSVPYKTRWYAWLAFPIGMVSHFCVWMWAKTFVATCYLVKGIHAQTWVIPRYGFHYFIPFCARGINQLIERAILDANDMGVQVISLAALNKNESLNGGGTLFVNKHTDLRVRVVHGNTLTAALVLKELPPDTKEVFLTGATSKIGRAVALYLCRKNVRVLMLTTSRERFQSIAEEASEKHRHNLVQVTKYQAGQSCKRWIVGKWTSFRDQNWAPQGTHFHQFVIPPVKEYRRDCTYGKLAGMRLPASVQGVYSCEYTFDRGVVAACHAGGLVHSLEKWRHHEVGSIDVAQIDVVWEAALSHGLTPV